ncbi:O-glucosyltransferase rumi homolog [Linum grandiflorum]
MSFTISSPATASRLWPMSGRLVSGTILVIFVVSLILGSLRLRNHDFITTFGINAGGEKRSHSDKTSTNYSSDYKYPLINCSSLNITTSSASGPHHNPSQLSPTKTCPDYFRWIREDLRPWKRHGITREAVEAAKPLAHFRLVILNGKAYLEKFNNAFQTRDVFTLWGILQLLRLYPGRVPDLELMFRCEDRPAIHKGDLTRRNSSSPPVLFHYCGDEDALGVVFPDWTFWGWGETNIKPWKSVVRDINEKSKKSKWEDRVPSAYWKGNPNVSAGRYKIYIEGYGWSVSEKYIMACDSMTLLVKPQFHDFFTRGLMPLRHYWPIRPENKCRDIKFAVEWGNSNPNKVSHTFFGTGNRRVGEQIHEEGSEDGKRVRLHATYFDPIRQAAEIQAKVTTRVRTRRRVAKRDNRVLLGRRMERVYAGFSGGISEQSTSLFDVGR